MEVRLMGKKRPPKHAEREDLDDPTKVGTKEEEAPALTGWVKETATGMQRRFAFHRDRDQICATICSLRPTKPLLRLGESLCGRCGTLIRPREAKCGVCSAPKET